MRDEHVYVAANEYVLPVQSFFDRYLKKVELKLKNSNEPFNDDNQNRHVCHYLKRLKRRKTSNRLKLNNWQVHLAGDNDNRARFNFIAAGAAAGAGKLSDDGDVRLGFQAKLRANTGVKVDVPLPELDDFFQTETLWGLGEQFVLEITLNEDPRELIDCSIKQATANNAAITDIIYSITELSLSLIHI